MNETDKPIEVEAVPTQAVAVRTPSGGLPTVADLEQQFALAVRQRELLSDYIKKQLKPGQHFYQRGDQKPSLSKEGAEIILMPHNLAPDYELVAGPSEPPEGDRPYQITVKCTLRVKGHPDSFVGSGMGSAGSQHGFWNKETKKFEYKARQPDRYLCHNATLKMAQKSAMIAATINSTAASEFFTQDMDSPETPQDAPRRSAPPLDPGPSRKAAATPKPAPAPTAPNTKHLEECRSKLVKNVETAQMREKSTQFLIDLAWLMPNEPLEKLELRFVPQTKDEYLNFLAKVALFAATGKAEKPYAAHWEAEKPAAPKEAPPSPPVAPATDDAADQPWYHFVVPIPRKGQKRDDYVKHPDTIGSLFEARHETDEESQALRQRLWGFLNHFEPKPHEYKGKTYPPSDTDKKFRQALDAFGDWFEKHHHGEEL